jgi:hypothetical protein
MKFDKESWNDSMGSNHPAVGFEMPSSFFMSKAVGSGDFEMIHSTSIRVEYSELPYGPYISDTWALHNDPQHHKRNTSLVISEHRTCTFLAAW